MTENLRLTSFFQDAYGIWTCQNKSLNPNNSHFLTIECVLLSGFDAV